MENDKKVLVIDDEAYIRRVLEVKLKKYGYQVMLAKNGQEGFDMIQQQQPEIVISDINMPVMDGKTLCEKTNGLKQKRPFLTIIITARIMPEDREWVVKMHDTLFMEKPFSPARIAECIKQYLEDKR
ncbi:MAG: response regulator [Deltaproteobacteria bacterium]|nr:response regulator [Deltaproteobacteria bacterium]